MSYAIVKTGGKQYRVQEGQSLLVERLPDDEGAKVSLEPLMYRGDKDGDLELEDLKRVQVEAKVVRHERGPRLRVVKFKPKKRAKKRTGHRQELTRIEVTAVKLQAKRSRAAAAKKEEGEEGA
jgi:large subunit ribosomal protein L21